MTGSHDEAVPAVDAGWDSLTLRLRALRSLHGDPSYAELARRVAEQRMARGETEHAARVARSSVHDTFRLGRTRINRPLIEEIVTALGEDPAVVSEWIAARDVDASRSDLEEAEEDLTIAPPPPVTRGQAVALMTACVVLNLIGREFVDFFHFPLYLDMVGTAIAAIALGPWRGAAVGLTTNVVGIVGSGLISLPFALVNTVGALVWGYGVRRFGMGTTLARYFLLNVLVALACSVIAVPIILTFLNEELRIGHDVFTQLVSESIDEFLVAVSFSNILTSLWDKLLSGFLAIVAISSLPLAFRVNTPLVFTTGQDVAASVRAKRQ